MSPRWHTSLYIFSVKSQFFNTLRVNPCRLLIFLVEYVWRCEHCSNGRSSTNRSIIRHNKTPSNSYQNKINNPFQLLLSLLKHKIPRLLLSSIKDDFVEVNGKSTRKTKRILLLRFLFYFDNCKLLIYAQTPSPKVK